MEQAENEVSATKKYDPEFEELWNQVLRNTPTKDPGVPAKESSLKTEVPVITSDIPAPANVFTVARGKVPRVGTVIERSTANNNRKLRLLTTPPPPPPPRRNTVRGKPRSDTNRAREKLIKLFGDSLSDLSEEESATDPIPSKRKLNKLPSIDMQPPPAVATPPPTKKMTTPSTSKRPSPTVSTGQTPSTTSPSTTNASPPKPTTDTVTTSKESSIIVDTPQAANISSTDPPPVPVKIGDITVEVPFRAVHKTRKYKARVGNRSYRLRFDHLGRCRFFKELT